MLIQLLFYAKVLPLSMLTKNGPISATCTATLLDPLP